MSVFPVSAIRVLAIASVTGFAALRLIGSLVHSAMEAPQVGQAGPGERGNSTAKRCSATAPMRFPADDFTFDASAHRRMFRVSVEHLKAGRYIQLVGVPECHVGTTLF